MNIPDFCYSLNKRNIDPETKIGHVTKVKALQTGYFTTTLEATQEEVDAMNNEIGVSIPEAHAMETASMFGWETYIKALESSTSSYLKKMENQNGSD